MQPTWVSSNPEPAGPDATEIRHALGLVLESRSFRGSKRCHDFLAYVVTKALEGNAEKLKERTLAVEVFGRKADADLGDDSIVRVGAREVRKRLFQYYSSDGASDPIRIDLPAGSYAPAFHWHTDTSAAASNAVPTIPVPAIAVPGIEPVALVGVGNRRKRWVRPILLTVTLAVGASLAGWRLWHRTSDEFDTFWRPVFAQRQPVLIALAHPIVYHPSAAATRLNDERAGPSALPVQRPIELPPELLDGSDFVPVFNQYVGFGDTVAVSRLSVLFAGHGQVARVRLASKLEFSDVRDSATVLIGAFTNRWTMEVAAGLRYRFALSGSKPCVIDSATGKMWTLTKKSDDGNSPEDYIVISRLIHAQIGSFVLIGAGLTQYGTEEAGRILAEPEAMDSILRKFPRGWSTHNLELVLHSRVVGGSPAPPELVASYIW